MNEESALCLFIFRCAALMSNDMMTVNANMMTVNANLMTVNAKLEESRRGLI